MLALHSGRRISIVAAVVLLVAGAVGADPVGASSTWPVVDEVMLFAAPTPRDNTIRRYSTMHHDPRVSASATKAASRSRSTPFSGSSPG